MTIRKSIRKSLMDYYKSKNLLLDQTGYKMATSTITSVKKMICAIAEALENGA